MRDRQIVLSRRLRMLAGMVTKGYRAADVGCDHGFLSIYLIQQGISSRVLAMDVRKGPLTAAQEHITACGLETYIESRLSDGLAALCPGEAETLICAGMGGPQMEKILRDGMEKARGLKELILQPQSEVGAFRRFLRREGFRILAEDAVCEDGKYYFAMKAVYVGAESLENPQETPGSGETAQVRDAMPPGEGGEAARELADEYGELLLRERHPVLKQYLNFRKGVLEQLEERLRLCADEGREADAAARAKERLAQVRRELRGVNEALRQWDDPLGTIGVKRHFVPDINGRR